MNDPTKNVMHDALKSLLHKAIEHTANSVECPFVWAYQPKRPRRMEEKTFSGRKLIRPNLASAQCRKLDCYVKNLARCEPGFSVGIEMAIKRAQTVSFRACASLRDELIPEKAVHFSV